MRRGRARSPFCGRARRGRSPGGDCGAGRGRARTSVSPDRRPRARRTTSAWRASGSAPPAFRSRGSRPTRSTTRAAGRRCGAAALRDQAARALRKPRRDSREHAVRNCAQAHARVVRLLQSRAVRALRDPDADAVLIEGYIPGERIRDRRVARARPACACSRSSTSRTRSRGRSSRRRSTSRRRAPTQRRQRAIERARRVGCGGAGPAPRPDPRGVPRGRRSRVRAGSGGAADRRAVRPRAAVRARRERQIPLEELLLRHALGQDSAARGRAKRRRRAS